MQSSIVAGYFLEYLLASRRSFDGGAERHLGLFALCTAAAFAGT